MKLLIDLYKISSPTRKEKEMIRFIVNRLEMMSIPYELDKHGNIYATKGSSETYPCVVAHTDEVHLKRNANYEVISLRDELIMGYDTRKKRFAGIGADDKNGIWICLKCLEEYEYMKCAFFMGEEEGCIGSNRADMTFFDDCRYVLQCDRKGNGDFITTISGVELCSRNFVKDINLSSYGYKTTVGLQTDVAVLKQRGLDVSCANISCGYYNPHTSEEYTSMTDLCKCHQLVKHIIDTCNEPYKHSYQPLFRNWMGRDRYSHYYHNSETSFDKEESALAFSSDIADKGSMQKNEYMCLLNILSKRLAFDENLTVKEIMEIYKRQFPSLRLDDYESAYREVMG